MPKLALCVLIALLPVFAAAPARGADVPDPAAYRKDVMKDGNLKQEGEGFCWHAAYSAGGFLAAYEAFHDEKWLVEAAAYYDWFISKLKKDPDGYEGWIGPTITNTPEIQEDALVGDAILCGHLAAFAELVLKDAELRKRFGEKAREYVDLATRIVWEKWNKRGCYYQDQAGFGSYRTHGRAIDAKTGLWVERPETIMSQPLNKSCDAAIVLLRLWRITGKAEYRERVERIFKRAKMLFKLYSDDDRVAWNYWDPHAPCDIEGSAPKHWVGVHPERPGYQVGEVNMFTEVYDSGLVFEQADLERMIRTNHWMAKGDGKNPWRSADGTSPAGALWTGLARFDETIRKQYEESLAKQTGAAGQINLAYYKNVTSRHLNWDRLYVKDPAQVTVPHPPLQPGRFLGLALPIPDVVETANAGHIALATKANAAGTLKIELLDASGKEVLGTLASSEISKDEFAAPRWDGTNPRSARKDEGEYRIRWSLNGESRLEPVWVMKGTKHAAAGPAPLAPGQTLTVDFAGPLDARWRLEGAAPSAEQTHSGKKSLKLIEGQLAVLDFGADEDLPVKVRMWVFDNGKKLGKGETKTGGGWGVKTGGGDKFCLRTCWRSYLGGNDGYAWFNTGQNQWHSPGWSRVARKDGWSEWVFDFTDPAAPKITGGGMNVSGVPAKYLPKGAAAVYLLGGDSEAGALYVDDLSVEYPKK